MTHAPNAAQQRKVVAELMRNRNYDGFDTEDNDDGTVTVWCYQGYTRVRKITVWRNGHYTSDPTAPRFVEGQQPIVGTPDR